jgi:metallo-beta-lactamase class B
MVELGGATLVARKTAGHTKGCVSWTMVVDDAGKRLNTVIVGGPTLNPGYNLINDPKYPQMAADYKATFRTLKSLPCDLFLGAHGGYFDLLSKYAALKTSRINPFIDPAGYTAFVAAHERVFEAELARQKKAAKV